MKNKVCIVVPFRNREEHLKVFAPMLTDFLKKEGTDGRIFLIEQADEKPFNRAKLLNVGFHYVEKNFPDEYSHYCFHDVDMVPKESDYSYCSYPTHLAARAQQFGYTLPYDRYFGGVTIFDKKSFLKINGYSNDYWGWGAEDDDVFNRCVTMKIATKRKDGRYDSLHHERRIEKSLYDVNVHKLRSMMKNFNGDSFTEGLSTLNYDLEKEESNILYERIFVKI